MKYNFDQVINRNNTDSLKYDFAKRRGMPEDILPLWVADMDFQTPPEVIDVLVERSKHGIFGYSESREEYQDILAKWFKRYFDWTIDPRWLVKTPGVVYGVATAIRAYTQPNDGVLIQEPVYYPFKEAIEVNGRKVVINELIFNNGKYSIDFEDFEKQIIKEEVKLFILCSPHNPVGRVWTKEELIRLGDICLKHNVLVIADEIHGDFTYGDRKHYVFANLKPEFLENSITATSPSKTFNLAGLQLSNIFIANRKKRHQFRKEITKGGYSQVNIMGILSCQAAYEHGHEWLAQLKEYLSNNLEYVRKTLKEQVPKLKLVEPEGTYLIWIDFSGLNLSEEEVNNIMINKAKLWLDCGSMFGESGKGFQRINIAAPKSIIEQGMDQLIEAFKDI